MKANTLVGKRILVVEDDAFIADDLQAELAKLGAEIVGPASSDDEAIGLVRTSARLDAAVLNIGLRDAPSFDLARVLLATGVPFVFASGHVRDVVPYDLVAVPFFRKPADPAEIAFTLIGQLGS
jgi:CheY-like chemotaxis protein